MMWEEDENNSEEATVNDIAEIAEELLVIGIVHLLKPDEGIVLHHKGGAYAIYNNSVKQQLSIIEDEDYLEAEHGSMIWMHYDGSTAPEPTFDELVIGKDEIKH